MGYDIEKEKREAIEAGQRALSSLRTAKENLNSAKNWGLVDMFGGGFFSTMLKPPRWIRQDKIWNRRNMIFVISVGN